VKDTQGDLYVLRHDVASYRWELTWFRCSTEVGTNPPAPQIPDDPR
jgi:hypothetical protein